MRFFTYLSMLCALSEETSAKCAREMNRHGRAINPLVVEGCCYTKKNFGKSREEVTDCLKL